MGIRFRLQRQILILSGALVCASSALAGPWSEHSARLGVLSKTIESSESEIKSLLDHKHHAEEAAELKHIVDELAAKHKALAEASVEYEDIRLHVRFKHPDLHDALERKYIRYDLKSLQQMEADMGIDGQLDRIKARALATFPLPPKPIEEKKKPVVRVPASLKPIVVEDEDTPEPIKLVK